MQMRPYFEKLDILSLYATMASHPNLRFERIVDTSLEQSFLSIQSARGDLLALVNLNAHDWSSTTHFSNIAPGRSLDTFVKEKSAWLFAEEQ